MHALQLRAQIKLGQDSAGKPIKTAAEKYEHFCWLTCDLYTSAQRLSSQITNISQKVDSTWCLRCSLDIPVFSHLHTIFRVPGLPSGAAVQLCWHLLSVLLYSKHVGASWLQSLHMCAVHSVFSIQLHQQRNRSMRTRPAKNLNLCALRCCCCSLL
jgi:hypothetical protein